jgi:hypothetical protein
MRFECAQYVEVREGDGVCKEEMEWVFVLMGEIRVRGAVYRAGEGLEIT